MLAGWRVGRPETTIRAGDTMAGTGDALGAEDLRELSSNA